MAVRTVILCLIFLSGVICGKTFFARKQIVEQIIVEKTDCPGPIIDRSKDALLSCTESLTESIFKTSVCLEEKKIIELAYSKAKEDADYWHKSYIDYNCGD